MSIEANATSEGTKTDKKPKVSFRTEPDQVPKELYGTVKAKLGDEAVLYPARNGGGYKGPVIHTDDKHIVQAIGKDQRSAVMHRRDDVNLQGSDLLSRDANPGGLIGKNIQVHYNSATEKGKAYPWNAELEAKQQRASAEQRVSPAEKLMAVATKHAEAHMTPKQRDTFLSNVALVAAEAFPERTAKAAEQGQPAKQAAAPESAKAPARPAPQRAKQERQPEAAQER